MSSEESYEDMMARIQRQREADGNSCDRGCPALNGTGVCVGRSAADHSRPMVRMKRPGVTQLNDLQTDKIDAIPDDCPFGFRK